MKNPFQLFFCRSIFLSILLFSFSTIQPIFSSDLPVALVGDSYGTYEVTSIIRNIFDKGDWVIEPRGAFLPIEDFDKYSLIIISTKTERPYTSKEHEKIKEYLEKGGRLLLIHQAPLSMADQDSQEALYDWFGMHPLSVRKIKPETANIANDPITAELKNSSPRPSWITPGQGVGKFADDVVPLVSDDEGSALIARRDVGKGRVYFMGSEMFRLRTKGSKFRDQSDSYVDIARKIVEEANPQTYSDWHKVQSKDWQTKGKRFLFWDREWQRGIEKGPVFQPPLPTEEEILHTISVDLALDEYETIQLNFTDLGKGGNITWKVENLPEGLLDVRIQDRPDPIPWPKNPEIAKESPYWLMEAKDVEPKGKDSVHIGAGETRIFWLKFNSHGQKPQKSDGTISFLVDGKPAGDIDLKVILHSVRIPKRRPITLRPAGHSYGSITNVPVALRFKRNLRDLGYEWTSLNPIRPDLFIVNDEPITVATLKKNLDAILSENPPFIDFSIMDDYIDASLAHNLTYLSTHDGLTSSIDTISKRAGLDEEQTKKVRHWYVSELRRYLNDKGNRYAYVSRGDELSAEKLKEVFIPWSEDLAESGWQTSSSFTTDSVGDIELTQRLANTVGMWTLNRRFLQTFTDWVREGKIKLPEGTLIGSYGAGEGRGTEIRKNESESRMIGWESWKDGADYCAPNPYFKGWLYYVDYNQDRGIAGERFLAYLHKDDLDAPMLNSPFVEGIRESLEEGNLAYMMSWYLQKLGNRVPKSLRDRAKKIIGFDEDSILQLKSTEKSGFEKDVIKAKGLM